MTPPPTQSPVEKKNRDISGWIQVGLGVLAFFGVSGAIFGVTFDKKENYPSPKLPEVTVAPTSTTLPPVTRPEKTQVETRDKPVETPGESDGVDAILTGDWNGTSQLSAYESTSLRMALSLGEDGRYTWTRDVIHDSGYWEVQGGSIAFEQDAGGQYQWPFKISGSGSRQVLKLITTQGGTTTLHRAAS